MIYNKQKVIDNVMLLIPGIEVNISTLMVEKAEKSIKVFCRVEEVTEEMEDVLEDLAIYKYNTIDRLGIQSESMGKNSISLSQNLPADIKARLLSFKTTFRAF